MTQKNKTYSLTNRRGDIDAYITSDGNLIVLGLTKMWGTLLLDPEVKWGKFSLDDFIDSINPKNSAKLNAILNVVSPYIGDDSQSMSYVPHTDKVVMIEQSPADGYATIKIVTSVYEKIVAQFDSIEDVTGKVTIV